MNLQPAGNHLIGFIQYLRQEGYNIGIRETLDVFKILGNTAYPDNLYTRLTIRSLSCHTHDEWQRFNQLYNHFWFPENQASNKQNKHSQFASKADINQQIISGISGESRDYTDLLRSLGGLSGSGAGRQRTITKADFRFLNDRRAARDVEKFAERLALLLKKRLKRRRIIVSHGKTIDIRKTFRSNMKYGGTPVHPMYSKRRQEHPHIIILHDVSHSMAWNNPLLFRFARGLVRTFSSCEAFAFHTRLFRVTELYRERSLDIMRSRFEAKNHLWLGGTCIADSIREFMDKYGSLYIRPDSIIMIISDGFDTNAPQYLGEQLQQLKFAAQKLIWLNPMLEREGFEPDTAFLQYVASNVDYIGPAHSLKSLEDVINYLSANRSCLRRGTSIKQ